MLVRSIFRVAVATAIALAMSAPPASAQVNGANIDINAFKPAMDSRGFVTVNAAQVLGHNELSFGLFSTYRRNPVVFENGNNEFAVQNLVVPTLIAAYGLKFGPVELEIGANLPFALVSGDRSPDYEGFEGNPNDDESFGFDGQGIGDLGLTAKLRLLNNSRHGIGLAVLGGVRLPTASEEDVWLGDKQVAPRGMLIVDKSFGRGKFRVGANVGITVLPDETTFSDTQPVQAETPDGCAGATDCQLPVDISTGQSITSTSSIPFGVAIAYAVSRQKFDLIAEVYGAMPLEGERYAPIEAIGAVKLYLARNSFLTLGGGVGLLDSAEDSPDVRAFIGIVFEPNIGDRDGDGIKDDVDQCPDDPEDYDDFEDADGCPDPDNDRDGILDEDDACPNEPEDKDGFEDEDGCPEGNELDRDGDGILDDVDQCPDDPEDKDGFEDEDGCPDPDNDEDGILDVDDLCPDDPEDEDGFEDEDGCPDPDNDRDRILDLDDACPNEPETYNGTDDEDGCPDRGRVVVTDTKMEILDKIYFEYNKAKIKSQSYPILDAIVATLNGNPDIELVEIQGHTDNRGSDSYNLDLSDKRAAAVRQYLIDGGVDADRLTSQGYGETQPIDNKNNEKAWAKNRRVEFLIIKRADQ